MVVLGGKFALSCGLERITPKYTYISMYARTNRCYNERGSRTNYFGLAYPTVLLNEMCNICTVYGQKIFNPFSNPPMFVHKC